jgi:hypothetical protein
MDPIAEAPPEIRLILCCSRTRMDERTTHALRGLAGRIDWPSVIPLALAQGVLPLVYTNLRALVAGEVPAPLLADMRDRFHGSVRRSLLLTQELLAVLARFEAENLPVIPFKGPVLGADVYGNVALRQFTDLDLLVRPGDVPAARRLLTAAGYAASGFASDWEWNFENRHGVAVDLHQAIASAYEPSPAGFDELWARRRPVTIGPASIQTLSPEDMLLTLSIQFVKDCRERRERLVQLCDVAEALRAWPALDYELLMRRARACHAERILLLDLLLAQTLFSSEISGEIAGRVRSHPQVQPLMRQVIGRLVRTGPRRPPTDLVSELWHEDSAFYLRTRERWRDKAGYLLRLTGNMLRMALTPTVKDRSFLPLPSWLGFLHYLSRPVRIVRERFARSKLKVQTERAASNR